MDTGLSRLLAILEERDIPLGRDDIAWAFERPDSSRGLTAWIAEYLSPATLLTKGELQFITTQAPQDVPLTSAAARPPADLDVESAIQSLEASTAAIEGQCRALETQTKFLKQLADRRHVPAKDADDSLQEQQQARLVRERAQLEFESDELAHILKSELQAAAKQVEMLTGKSSHNTERVLEKDDRLLGGLQKLVPRLTDSSEQLDGSEEVEQLCSALSTLTVKEIHRRLDATYTSTLAQQLQKMDIELTNGLTEQQTKQRGHLRAELDELGSEIESLVTIAIDAHYRKPLKRKMVAAQVENQNQKTQWTEYTILTLQYLAARMEILTDHVQQMHSYNDALRALMHALQEFTKPLRQDTDSNLSAGAQDKAAVKGLKPLRLVQANLPEAHDPILQILRQLDVRLADVSGATTLTDVLASALDERRTKLAQLNAQTDNNFTDMLSSSLTKTDAHVQALLSAVYAQSKYGSVKLLDTDVQAALRRLGNDTQAVGDDMRELDVDALSRDIKRKQADIVARLA